MADAAADLPASAPVKRRRHRWPPDDKAVRPDERHTYRECLNCGCLKVSRHEGDEHWVYYDDGDKRHTKAPACQ